MPPNRYLVIWMHQGLGGIGGLEPSDVAGSNTVFMYYYNTMIGLM